MSEAVDKAKEKLADAMHNAANKLHGAEVGTLVAIATAHRRVSAMEHDPSIGKIEGMCPVCATMWPCSAAQYFLRQTDFDEKSAAAEAARLIMGYIPWATSPQGQDYWEQVHHNLRSIS